jgi:hypothetical protein
MGTFVVLLIVAVVAGALIARGVRAGLSGAPRLPDNQLEPPANNGLMNWLAYENLQQAQSAPAPTDGSSIVDSSFSGGDSNPSSTPQPDSADAGSADNYAGDPGSSGYDPSSVGGSDGGGFAGGSGDAF